MIKGFSFLSFFFLISCHPDKKLNLDFNGEEIFKYVEEQVDFGPRLNNSPEKEKCIQWIKERCKKLNYPLELDRWQEVVNDRERNFTNIIITKKGLSSSKDFVIVASHYDTKKIDSQPAFIGANDGASSTAALIAIMEELVHWENKKTIIFIFFDGEECFGANNAYRRPFQGSINGLHGSHRYAQQLLYQGKVENCSALLLMDMVGDRELGISFPHNNSKPLIQKALSIAQKDGLGNYFSSSKRSILDDHVPFYELGIPTINFIDFQYGKNNKFWHTEEDSLDKLSSKSLAITAHVVGKLLKHLAK